MSESNSQPESAQPMNYKVADERVIRVTQDAADKISSLLKRQNRPEGVLRILVTGGGCSGLQYKIDLQDEPAARDILVESKGVRIVMDPKSVLYVSGSELDYVDALQGAGFKVNNPNATSTCACGESFSA
ncbi:MAG: iron-sulfur cluster insertion protein ErpA [Verrucomicrobia bacterium]|nr:iron-sulfur cluster insertion protein ErpA [Verrucomicrobiota bacterium]